MALVSVDGDLDDFDFEDVLEYVVCEIGYKKSKCRTKEDWQELVQMAKDIVGADGVDVENDIPSFTLEEKLKREHLIAVFNKYTLAQIQQALPE